MQMSTTNRHYRSFFLLTRLEHFLEFVLSFGQDSAEKGGTLLVNKIRNVELLFYFFLSCFFVGSLLAWGSSMCGILGALIVLRTKSSAFTLVGSAA